MSYDQTTLLVLSSFGVPPYSARGLTQTLEPIEQAKEGLWRTINGSLRDETASQFRKYRSTITGNDQNPPSVDMVWPGQNVTVDCIVSLAYQEGGSPGRTPVTGSTKNEGDYVIYRPQLEMMVVSFSIQEDEYGAQIGWTLELEEI